MKQLPPSWASLVLRLRQLTVNWPPGSSHRACKDTAAKHPWLLPKPTFITLLNVIRVWFIGTMSLLTPLIISWFLSPIYTKAVLAESCRVTVTITDSQWRRLWRYLPTVCWNLFHILMFFTVRRKSISQEGLSRGRTQEVSGMKENRWKTAEK